LERYKKLKNIAVTFIELQIFRLMLSYFAVMRQANFPRSRQRDGRSLRFFHIDLQIALGRRCAHEESNPPYYFPCRASLKRRRVTLAANESIFRFRSLSVSPRLGAECIHGRY